jgi:hypothetical protein
MIRHVQLTGVLLLESTFKAKAIAPWFGLLGSYRFNVDVGWLQGTGRKCSSKIRLNIRGEA